MTPRALQISRLRRRYTRVVKMGTKWNTYLQIGVQGFSVVEQTSLHRARWFAKMVAVAMVELLRLEGVSVTHKRTHNL